MTTDEEVNGGWYNNNETTEKISFCHPKRNEKSQTTCFGMRFFSYSVRIDLSPYIKDILASLG